MDIDNKLLFRSRNISDYEVLTKKSTTYFSLYCPQINLLIKGTSYDVLTTNMKQRINEHIKGLPKTQLENEAEESIKLELLNEKKSIQEDYKSKFQKKADTLNLNNSEKKDKIESSKNLKDEKNILRPKIPIIEKDVYAMDNYFYNPDVAI